MKKGFSIIEILVAASAASIIAATLLSVFLSYNSSFKRSTKEYRNYFYTMEALMFIEHEINTSTDIDVNNCTLELEFTGNIKKTIFLNNEGNLILIHTENGVTKAANNIVCNVNEFFILRKSNTLYISITLRNGEKHEKCIGIDI